MAKSEKRLRWQRFLQIRPHTFMIIVGVVAVASWFSAMWAKEEFERTSFMKKYASGPFRIQTLYDMGSPFNPQEPALSRYIGAYLSTATGPRTSNWVKVIGPTPPEIVVRCIYLHPEIECLDIDSRSINESVMKAASGLKHLKYFRVMTWVGKKEIFGPIESLPSNVEVAFLDSQVNDEFVKAVAECDANIGYISFWEGSLQEHHLDALMKLPHLGYLGYAMERSPDVRRPIQGTGTLEIRLGNAGRSLSQKIAGVHTSRRPIQVIQEPTPHHPVFMIPQGQKMSLPAGVQGSSQLPVIQMEAVIHDLQSKSP